MPHATMEPHEAQHPSAAAEEEALRLALGGPSANGDDFLGDIAVRPLEVGEKADDAIDYEDMSDDDLPEEEDSEGNIILQHNGQTAQALNDDGNEEDDGFDELFGGSSPVQDQSQQDNVPLDSIETQHSSQANNANINSSSSSGDHGTSAHTAFRPMVYGDGDGDGDGDDEEDEDDDDDPELAEQRALFAQAGRSHDDRLPPPPQSSKEYFDRIWPDFEPGKPPRFFSLIPRKRAFFVPRTPLKPPKAMQLNKLSLDLAADQEKSFRLPSTGVITKATRQLEDEQRGLVFITDGIEEQNESSDDMEMDELVNDNDQEKIGNISWSDLRIACEDWSLPCAETISEEEEDPWAPQDPSDMVVDGNEWIYNVAPGHTNKKRKLDAGLDALQFSVYDHMDLPSWDDPELATAKIAKKIILDMNDPHLLLDVQRPNAEQAKPRAIGLGLKRDNRGSLANPMFKRYNISNDEAYDALKENSQQKVRSTLGHMNVEHSLPALKLQYPFYKLNLSDRELRSFHRPSITFKAGERVSISALKSIKKKHKRNLKPSEAFATAEDLGIGDTSDLLLAEYSEEYPTTLSNFGMGNKIVHYYRRKDNEDTSRPKFEFGETAVLLPQDKSPFSLFGTVDPGQTVPTLHNAMYRAPVFSHKPKSTDFLVSRSHSGVHGSHYYMRNIQNLMVVGQEFPSVEVPGTHARKVTEASKKRLKMLAFRLYRKGQQRGARQPWVSNDMIKHHLPGTEIAQNRSRMREIMKYVKETGTWQPLDGETIPDEPTLRTWIKPEDICLIDSMHAGDKHLMDAGFKANEIKDDDNGDEGEPLELKLAPWHTTKNFLNACQGKAMLELHGDGDPTARGEGFSFIKVSMKGGFKDVGESVADKVNAKASKELGGHSYNVQRQQHMYENAIQRIWSKQKESLSSTMDHSDVEMDVDSVDARPTQSGVMRGRSEQGTPVLMRGDDDTMSQLSRNSANDTRGKKLRIRRWTKNKAGEEEETVVEITDPEVVKLYTKRKKQERLDRMRLDDIKPSGNPEFDAQQQIKLRAELARLTRNVERREGREKAKGLHSVVSSVPGTPAAGASTGVKNTSTPRKCANCGEVGHIKTNKKMCPLLNGAKKMSDTFKDAGGVASPVPVGATPLVTSQPAGSPPGYPSFN
ncbi:hypothetical protein K504DRAFT_458803 [Pleomassaria siparia CBS 279.74]|uniref:Transcription initiation factor TFIID subunit 1 histone acetyltransferase domain-containing protein n=1 Tax=Pleomassaria siparia CBS 279.74 TaxID=1314801 RepID=A0A6G1K4R6_9PLEO|nr:hypothetical protein K504DRAFT_458803 [Pleomassaria siparia CBS 279.74]